MGLMAGQSPAVLSVLMSCLIVSRSPAPCFGAETGAGGGSKKWQERGIWTYTDT